MAKHAKRTSINIPMCVAGVLFCLTLITTHMTGGLFARYVSSGEMSDNARVAVMAMNSTYTIPIDLYGAPGETKEINITLTNKSGSAVCEVAQKYTLSVENLTGNLDLSYKYYIIEDIESGTNKEIEVDTVSGKFSAGVEQTANYKVKITWPDDVQSARNEKNAFEVDALRIVIKTEQID